MEVYIDVKIPTIWTDGKQRWEESEKRREEERSEKRKNQKKEDVGVQKGSKVATPCVFPMICRSGRSRTRLTKAAGAEPIWADERCKIGGIFFLQFFVIFFPQQRELMGSSAQNSSGVHWCRRRVTFNRVPLNCFVF